jgi:hypothetical protein
MSTPTPTRKAATPAQVREAADILEAVLDAMPDDKTTSSHERAAFLRGALAAWRSAAPPIRKADR